MSQALMKLLSAFDNNDLTERALSFLLALHVLDYFETHLPFNRPIQE